MPKPTLHLIYASEQIEEVQQLLDKLDTAAFETKHNESRDNLSEALKNNPQDGLLLLINDNFLRSLNCMEEIDDLTRSYREQLLCIAVPSIRENPDGVAPETYYASFTTINESMKYRDYWYDEWIRLRKARNQATDAERAAIEAKVAVAHKASTTVGAFIRTINSAGLHSLDDLVKDDYQLVFELLGLEQMPAEQRFSTDQAAEQQAERVTPPETEELVEEEEKVEEITVPDVQPRAEQIDIEEKDDKDDDEEDEVVAPVELVDPVELEEAEVVGKPENLETEEEEEEEEEHAPIEDPLIDALPEGEDDDSSETAETTEASRLVEKLDIEEADDEDDFLQLANQATEDGNFKQARQLYEQILEKNPLNGRAYAELAHLLVHHFDNQEIIAVEHYKKAVILNEPDADLYYDYGWLLKNRFDEAHFAAEQFRDAVAINTLHDDAYFALAECLLAQGDKDEARGYYLQAALLSPTEYQRAANDKRFGVHRPEEIADLEPEEEAVPLPLQEEERQTVLITGATSGIGRATARLFAEKGYRLILTGRREDRLEKLKAELDAFSDVHTLSFDVREPQASQQALESLPAEWREVDILINNAGLAKGLAPIHKGNLEHWETMIDTNIKGLLYMTRLIAPQMVKREKGHIVNIGSTAGKEVYPDGNVYCASKSAVDALTHAMRLDLHQYNIRVTGIHPAHVEDTEFAEVRLEDAEKAKIYEDFNPLKAEDVAAAIHFSLSRPAHVNIKDMILTGTQQADSSHINRSGRIFDEK